jgi:hypothetical protein
MSPSSLKNKVFYSLKPAIPRSTQLVLRRLIAQRKLFKCESVWPINPRSSQPPEGWIGWPGGKQFALVLSHDVDTLRGYNKVLRLADLEEELGFRSQFNFVPERYGKVELSLLSELKARGFGIGVHGLKHDGKLFSTIKIFRESVLRINSYLEEWGTRSFTAPSMIRNHEWMSELNIDFCISTFDTDPFEPDPEGVCTIFPFWVQAKSSRKGFLELPYTLVQDFTLFVILGKTIGLWELKLDWIAANGGMALLNSHPDYMNFRGGRCSPEEYPAQFYRDFLKYAKSHYVNKYWTALPQDVWSFWIEGFGLPNHTLS